MLDIRKVRENPEQIATALKIKGYDFDVNAFIELDAKRKSADITSQNLQAEKKKASKQIGLLIKDGMSPDEAKQKVMSGIETQLKDAVEEAKSIQESISDLLMAMPNIPDESVPAGKDEDDNVEVRTWGEPTELSFLSQRIMWTLGN